MGGFINDDFLLEGETARVLYHDHAESMPVIDYHNHLNPREIAEDTGFESITEVWLGGDHYKWRAMRGNGIPEEVITGKDTDPYTRFEAWAKTIPNLFGNPLFHWTALELKRYFDVDEILSAQNAREIYGITNDKLKSDDFSVKNLLVRMNVDQLCTTDDPADELPWHIQLQKTEKRFTVRPTFRPERAMNIDKPDFTDYLERLGEAADVTVESFDDLLKALEKRLDYFVKNGCRITDHSLEGGIYVEATREEASQILRKRLDGEALAPYDVTKYKGAILRALAGLYEKRGLVMQLHIGAMRNNNSRMFGKLGADSGFDSVDDMCYARELSALLDACDREEGLPRTILYNLNGRDYSMIGTMLGNFQDGKIAGKIQLGPAWWFMDHKDGMEEQMRALCDYGVFAHFTGMVTDSRSFLSFSRHEYFRRILCNFIGKKVDGGEYPKDMDFLGKMVENICTYNSRRFLGLDEK